MIEHTRMVIEGEGFVICQIEETEEDLAAALAVYQQCEDFLALGPVATASVKMVKDDLNHSREDGGTFCLIRVNTSGEVLGVVDFVSAGFCGDPTLGFLSLLMISAKHRAKGLGTQVVRAVEGEILRDGKVKAIESGVQVNNPQAIRFWERMGYRIVSEARPMPDGTTVFRLWKDG